MSVFYSLNRGDHSCVNYNEDNDWEGIICPVDPGHQRAGRRITKLKLDLVKKSIVDFSFSMLADMIVTDRALKYFREAGLTGFRADSTEIVRYPKGWDKQRNLVFWEIIIAGSAGHAHPDSGIRLLRQCDACGSVEYSAYENGIIVDESRWDGADFFTVVEYPRFYLVTERAKRVILENELTNIQLVPSHLLEWPESVIRPK